MYPISLVKARGKMLSSIYNELMFRANARLGMLATAHCGSGRQCVTGACRQATDTGRQIAGSRRQVAGSGRLSMGQYKLSYLKVLSSFTLVGGCSK